MKCYKLNISLGSEDQPNLIADIDLPDEQEIIFHCSNHGATLIITPTSKTKRPYRKTTFVELLIKHRKTLIRILLAIILFFI